MGNDLHVGFVATVDAAGAAEVERVGSLVRDVAGLTPLVLADGTRAIAWADNNLPLSVPPFAGRLHLALEGAPGAPAVPAPELVVGAPAGRVAAARRSLGFGVVGTRARSERTTEEPRVDSAPGKGRRRFHVRLTGAARVRWVRVHTLQDVGSRRRVALVRVT